jgi:hypothetical protein
MIVGPNRIHWWDDEVYNRVIRAVRPSEDPTRRPVDPPSAPAPAPAPARRDATRIVTLDGTSTRKVPELPGEVFDALKAASPYPVDLAFLSRKIGKTVVEIEAAVRLLESEVPDVGAQIKRIRGVGVSLQPLDP